MNYKLPPLPIKVRPLSDEQANWVAENHPTSIKKPEHCVTCGGKKEFDWYVPGSRTEVGHYDCSCNDQFILYRVLLYAGIGLNYQRISWLDFYEMKDEQEKAATDYLDKAPAYVAAGIGQILTGGRGAGKTMHATLMLKELMAQGFSGRYSTMAEMVETFTSGWKSQATKTWFDRQVRNVDVLVVDDLGRESTRGGLDTAARPVAASMIEEVLRHRAQHAKPTIITTNLPIDEIQKGYGGSAMSLLRERSLVLKFNGIDERERVANRNVAEVGQGLTRPIVVN